MIEALTALASLATATLMIWLLYRVFRGRGLMMWTASGRHFWPLDPLTEDVVLEDVARGLANECRYAGQVLKFYSVAEHSVIVSRVVEAMAPPGFKLRWAFEALMHDAAEAYVGDVIRPLKYGWGWRAHRRVEARIQAVVEHAFGICSTRSSRAMIRDVDTRIIVDEVPIVCGGVRAAEMADAQRIYELGRGLGCGDLIACLPPEDAERAWLARYEELAGS